MRQIPDAETIAMVYNLLHYEGLFVGASSALNMVGAVKTAEAVGKGNTVGEQSVVPIDGCPGRRNSEVLRNILFFLSDHERCGESFSLGPPPTSLSMLISSHAVVVVVCFSTYVYACLTPTSAPRFWLMCCTSVGAVRWGCQVPEPAVQQDVADGEGAVREHPGRVPLPRLPRLD